MMNLRKLLPWNTDDVTDGEVPISPIRSGHWPPPPVRPRFAVTAIPFTEMQSMAQAIAKSGMFGVRDEAQALSLMLLCQAEGLHPALAVRRYHIIQNRPSMRADALQGEFEQIGAILWHERTEEECAATFFRDKRQVTESSLRRAADRYARLKTGGPVSNLAAIGEITIIRTITDAIEKKVAMTWNKDAGKWVLKDNWKQSPRQMLHARCLSEGVRAIAPGLIAGIYTEDEVLDFPEPEALMTAEDRVRQATANRIPESKTEDAELVRSFHVVTEENYNDIICHIGKAEGPILGKKVQEIPVKLLGWLQSHYGEGEQSPRWGNPPTEKDQRLKQAVDLALKKLE